MDKVFYTRSAGLRVPAKVVGRSDEGYVELEYHQDGVRVEFGTPFAPRL